MLLLIIQLAILIAVAFVLGCLIGSLYRRFNASTGTQGRTAAALALPYAARADATARTAKYAVPPVTASQKSAARSKAATATAKRAAPAKVTPMRAPAGRSMADAARSAASKASSAAASAVASVSASVIPMAKPGSPSSGLTRSPVSPPSAPAVKPAAKGRAAPSSAPKTVQAVASSAPVAAAVPKLLKTPRGGKRDNLTLIDGVGDKLEKDLNSLGIFHYDQVASWTPAETAWINRKIGFPGRVERENWIGKAAQLKSGVRTDFTRRVEAGKVGTSHRTQGGAGSAPSSSAARPSSSGSTRAPAAPLRGPAAKITSAASKPAASAANVASNIANAASAAATPTIKAAASTVTGAVVKAETAAKKAETAVKSAVKSTTAKSAARKPAGKK